MAPKGIDRDPIAARQNRSIAQRGRKQTQETKDKISAANKGQPSKMRGRQHAQDCTHCVAARAKNPKHGDHSRGKSRLMELGPPRLCGKGCGNLFWPRAISKHERVCTGRALDYRAEYGPCWSRIRVAILERDGWTCQGCGLYSIAKHKLVVHHLIPFREVRRHEEPNLITLCRVCHRLWHVELHKRG